MYTSGQGRVFRCSWVIFNRLELQNLVGHAVSDATVKNVASLAWALHSIQPTHQSETYANEVDDGAEFGADLVFNLPARFLVEAALGERGFQDVESNDVHASFFEGWSGVSDTTKNQSARKFDLSWLRDACGQMVRESNSQLSRDELAMAICRFLDSDKPGEEVCCFLVIYIFRLTMPDPGGLYLQVKVEGILTFFLQIAGDLLDLVGDSAFETVQDLIMVRRNFLYCSII